MISSHVPSRILCEELKALGYPQETEFYWTLGGVFSGEISVDHYNAFSAPLVSEMAEWITTDLRYCTFPEYRSIEKKWRVWTSLDQKWVYTDNSPDAYATQCIEILKAKEKT